jgi:hypothetical protein
MAKIAGMEQYRSPNYRAFWQDYTGSVEVMRKAVATLKASPYVDLPTLEYGRYQTLLVPLDKWEKLGSGFWAKEVGRARLELMNQLNNESLSKDEPNVKPFTRLALLDAAIRKCFNSEPPIPIEATAAQKKQDDVDRDVHTFVHQWEYDNGNDKPPTFLRYTMTCPYKPPKPNEI